MGMDVKESEACHKYWQDDKIPDYFNKFALTELVEMMEPFKVHIYKHAINEAIRIKDPNAEFLNSWRNKWFVDTYQETHFKSCAMSMYEAMCIEKNVPVSEDQRDNLIKLTGG